MIQVKDTTVLESLLIRPAHPRLIEVLCWICSRYPVVVLTGMFEERDYPSTHSTDPVRAMDIRSRVFQDPKAVEEDINAEWQYDPGRPEMMVALYHNVGRGWHFHVQVHDRTKRRRRARRDRRR